MLITEDPLNQSIAAVSVGIVKGKVILDLDYELDSQAEVDMNVVMTDNNHFIEVQGTGEQISFDSAHLDKMLNMARRGIKKIITEQSKSLNRS